MRVFIWLKETRNLYKVFLHIAVVVLGVEVLLLSEQLHTLKGQVSARPKVLERGDPFDLAGLRPINAPEASAVNPDARKSLVLVFNTVCPFCEKNMSSWHNLAYYAVQGGMNVYWISLDEPEVTQQYLSTRGEELTPCFSVTEREQFQEVNRVAGVPYTVLLDPTNKVLAAYTGMLDNSQIGDLLDMLVNQPQFTEEVL